jgi:hypothetical protein
MRYLFYLIFQYFLDWFIPTDNKNTRTSNSHIDKWKQHLINMQPILKLFQSNNDKGAIINHAIDIINHDFILFGQKYSFQQNQSNTFSSYQKINWHYDPFSKNKFPRKKWYRLVRKTLPEGSDLKYPWELSRFQHLILLGQAYLNSQDEKYSMEFVNQISDWIENNPVRYGINWSNTMEVGIRVANWTIALLYFIKSPNITEKFLSKYFQCVQQHGKHIIHNLENLQPLNSNHYIGNLLGLYILSSVCPFLKQSHKWFIFSKRELEKEIIRQTDDDGWDYESSTAYHRLVTEMFLYTFIIANYINQPFSYSYLNRLKKMLNNLNIIKKLDYTIPQIGDNDSGFSLIFDYENDNLNVNYLLILAERNNLIVPEAQTKGFFKYENAGFYIYKNDEIYLLIRAGSKKLIGLGSHAHNDILSYILNINGEDILIDPGTFVYMSDSIKRNHFRSIASHNTLYWDGVEPRNLTDGIFKLVETGTAAVETATGNSKGFKFIGEYYYKNRLHQRSVNYNLKDDYFVVTDKVSHDGAILNFTCGPKNPPHEIKNGFEINNVKFEFTGMHEILIQNSFYSSGYGKIQPINSVNVILSNREINYKILFKS